MTDLNAMNAQEVISALDLEYLDGEGVWIRLLWRTDHGNAIYGLLTPTVPAVTLLVSYLPVQR